VPNYIQRNADISDKLPKLPIEYKKRKALVVNFNDTSKLETDPEKEPKIDPANPVAKGLNALESGVSLTQDEKGNLKAEFAQKVG
jgi:hypothetical protein